MSREGGCCTTALPCAPPLHHRVRLHAPGHPPPAAAPRTQGDGADAAHQVAEGGVLDQVFQQLAVGGADELQGVGRGGRGASARWDGRRGAARRRRSAPPHPARPLSAHHVRLHPPTCTPRSAMVRQARASASVPISSTITTSGMWFSTASIWGRPVVGPGSRQGWGPARTHASTTAAAACGRSTAAAGASAALRRVEQRGLCAALPLPLQGPACPPNRLTMILCCWEGSGTCMRRAPPMAGCGTSPSPPARKRGGGRRGAAGKDSA